jgi:putative ABC transport system permease protein
MLVGAISAAVYISADSPDYAINIRKYATVPLLFVGAFALLSPLLLPPVARLVTGPLERFGAGALIVRQNILTAGRRTAATVSPVVVAVGLVAAMAGVQDTGDRTTTDQARSEIHADAVVLPAAGGGRLDHHSLAALAAVPGVSAVPVTPTRLYLGGPDGSVFDGVNSLAVDPAALGRVLTPKVVDGSLDHLGDDFLVIDEKTAADDDLSPGSKVPVWLADDSRTDLTVAAVVQAGLGTDNSYVSAAHAVGGLPDRAWLTFPAGTDPAAGVAKVAAALPHGAVRAATTAGYFDALGSAQRQQNRTSTELVLGVAVGYALISVANTLAMAAAGRRRELAAFNLAGATRAQALRVVTGEALVAALIGTVLAVAAGIASLLSQGLSLVVLAGTVSPSIPWSPIALAAAVSAAVAALAAAVSVARTFRGRAVELAGLRE